MSESYSESESELATISTSSSSSSSSSFPPLSSCPSYLHRLNELPTPLHLYPYSQTSTKCFVARVFSGDANRVEQSGMAIPLFSRLEEDVGFFYYLSTCHSVYTEETGKRTIRTSDTTPTRRTVTVVTATRQDNIFLLTNLLFKPAEIVKVDYKLDLMLLRIILKQTDGMSIMEEKIDEVRVPVASHPDFYPFFLFRGFKLEELTSTIMEDAFQPAMDHYVFSYSNTQPRSYPHPLELIPVQHSKSPKTKLQQQQTEQQPEEQQPSSTPRPRKTRSEFVITPSSTPTASSSARSTAYGVSGSPGSFSSSRGPLLSTTIDDTVHFRLSLKKLREFPAPLCFKGGIISTPHQKFYFSGPQLGGMEQRSYSDTPFCFQSDYHSLSGDSGAPVIFPLSYHLQPVGSFHSNYSLQPGKVILIGMNAGVLHHGSGDRIFLDLQEEETKKCIEEELGIDFSKQIGSTPKRRKRAKRRSTALSLPEQTVTLPEQTPKKEKFLKVEQPVQGLEEVEAKKADTITFRGLFVPLDVIVSFVTPSHGYRLMRAKIKEEEQKKVMEEQKKVMKAERIELEQGEENGINQNRNLALYKSNGVPESSTSPVLEEKITGKKRKER